MKHFLLLISGCLLLTMDSFAQTITQKLQKAFSAFEKDPQLKHAISSLYIIDAKTGQVVFDKHSRIGLAPASTQKIITSVTAFELLGKDYKYKTSFFTEGSNLFLVPSGDPSFGSWRWMATDIDSIFSGMISVLKEKGITQIRNVFTDNSGWDAESIPDGWIWQDIGNYYGAGAHKLNFRENQYDINLKSGNKIGDPVIVGSVFPSSLQVTQQKLLSKVTSAKKGSGDNAYVYLPDYPSGNYVIRGTIPVNEEKFTISASITNPEWLIAEPLLSILDEKINMGDGTGAYEVLSNPVQRNDNMKLVYTHYSPSLDSIIYWFNKKSVNLYGEALIKTFAYEKNRFGSTDSGVTIVKRFWKENGLDEDELNIVDGSGLSPLNRVTTHAQVEILKYAAKKTWYPLFKNSLPEYNKMAMKSGTIRGVKGFCGYHKATNGKEYIFSFLVNNYNGSASAVVNKMYRVLDLLK